MLKALTFPRHFEGNRLNYSAYKGNQQSLNLNAHGDPICPHQIRLRTELLCKIKEESNDVAAGIAAYRRARKKLSQNKVQDSTAPGRIPDVKENNIVYIRQASICGPDPPQPATSKIETFRSRDCLAIQRAWRLI